MIFGLFQSKREMEAFFKIYCFGKFDILLRLAMACFSSLSKTNGFGFDLFLLEIIVLLVLINQDRLVGRL